MTLQEAMDKGWKFGDTTFSRGYVSRKVTPDMVEVKVAGKGSRMGQRFVDLPCMTSTQYHLRQYLIEPERKG